MLRAGLHELQPNLLALQETVVTDDYDQVGELIDDGFHVEHLRARDGAGMGVSIVSRWPMAQVEELDLHLTARPDDFPCVTLAAEINLPSPAGTPAFRQPFPVVPARLRARARATGSRGGSAADRMA